MVNTSSDKLPPFAVEAEESVLGSILIDGGCMAILSEQLKPADFFREPNQWTFQACLALYQRDEGINQITLASELERQNKLAEVGGPAYLHHLVSVVPTSLHAEYYAKIVKDTSTNRRLIQVGGEIANIGMENGADTEKAVAKAEGLLSDLGERSSQQGYVPIRTIVEEYMETMAGSEERSSKRIPTGFSDLDGILGGMQGPDLIILAARPGVGKTSFLLNVALHAAYRLRLAVGILSLEMGKEQLLDRLVASHAGVELQRLRLGQMNETEKRRAMDALGELSETPIFVDDGASQDIATIRSRAKRLHAQRGIELLLVDYIGLVRGSGRRENRAQEVGEVSRGLKGLAKDLNIPVLVASQLNRQVEQRNPHIPMLSDLRESGELEQDADVVMFIYREDMYTDEEEWQRKNPNRPYPKGIADIIVAKHRNGPTGEASLLWMEKLTRFGNIELHRTELEPRDHWYDRD